MKKNLKLVLALIVAVMMIVSSISAIAATPEGLTADPSITISGLDDNDTVNLYKVIEWDAGDADHSANWKLTAPFADDAACKAVLQAINAVTDGVYSLTKADVKAFTDVINGGSADSVKTTGSAVANGSSTTTVAPGMYVALVKPAKPDTMYNPIIVSADYSQDNNTSEINASSATVGGNAGFAKKETTKVEKEQGNVEDTTDNDYNVGDTVPFTVTTTIPTFAEAYETPSFVITDTMSDGLAYTDNTIKVMDGDGNDIDSASYTFNKVSAQEWTVTFTKDYLKGLESPQAIKITFDAVITEDVYTSVNEETNDVVVEFSNNPDDDSNTGKVKDKTRSYTFSIDGNLLGGGGDRTSELIKVAVDGNGNPIMQSTATGVTYENALKGAKFGLYTNEAATTPYVNDEYPAPDGCTNIVTDENGYMEINGLAEGTYYLKELEAPAGYIKDQKIHKIEISATYGTETVSEDGYPDYTVPVLESYTITIDGVTTSTYTMKLSEEDITTSEANNPPTSIINTKGIELPSTGGMGTTIFYVGGSILVLAAAILLVTKRRMGVED